MFLYRYSIYIYFIDKIKSKTEYESFSRRARAVSYIYSEIWKFIKKKKKILGFIYRDRRNRILEKTQIYHDPTIATDRSIAKIIEG